MSSLATRTTTHEYTLVEPPKSQEKYAYIKGSQQVVLLGSRYRLRDIGGSQ